MVGFWHQLDHMQTICTSLLTDNHTNSPSVNLYRPDALPDAQQTASKHLTYTARTGNRPEDAGVATQYNERVECDVVLRVFITHCSVWARPQRVHCLTTQAVNKHTRTDKYTDVLQLRAWVNWLCQGNCLALTVSPDPRGRNKATVRWVFHPLPRRVGFTWELIYESGRPTPLKKCVVQGAALVRFACKATHSPTARTWH